VSAAEGYIDNPFSDHFPLPGRKKFHLPGEARIAFCVYLYLEYYELDPPPDALRDPRFSDGPGYFFPDYRSYSFREYGNRVGIFRILELLDRYGIKATVAANSDACRRYPFLVDSFMQRDYEFTAHGQFATRMISSRMSEEEERDHIGASIDALKRYTGVAPQGWIGQDYGESHRTPRMLAEAGLKYVVDWSNDDRPYLMRTDPAIVSIPAQEQWDDVQLIWHRQVSTSVFRDSVIRAFDTLWDEGASSGCVFGLHLHPWLIGTPQRIGALEDALAIMSRRRAVWQCRAQELAAHFAEESRAL
jgi:peptidoglycan/xylan/chitin deacetylase (PgdA/CDA1 family)